MIKKFLNDFCRKIGNGEIEVYNEFSLQHELGIFLRESLNGYKVQFERNVSFFGINSKETVKKEIDISIFDERMKKKYAIELKYPNNGRHPETMFDFVKDVKFMEQLKELGFNESYCMCLVTDKLFYSGDDNDGIYAYFRNGKDIQGTIMKPTGKGKGVVKLEIDGKYKAEWKPLNESYMHYIIPI